MIFNQRVHRFFFIFGIALALCSMLYSPFLLSVGFFTFSINWLLDGNWLIKYQRIKNNKAVWAFALVYFSIAFSFFYSQNLSRSLAELRVWVPLLVAPLVISTSDPIKRGEFRFLILTFSTAVFVSTVIGFVYYIRDYNYLGQDVRYLSPFILHIRFSLMALTSVFAIGYMVFKDGYFSNIFIKILLLLLALWFICFIFILQSLTGIVILFTLGLMILLWWAFKVKEHLIKYPIFVLVFMIILISSSFIAHSIDKYFTRHPINYKSLPSQTVNLNSYYHDTLSNQYENGYLVWINVCASELREEWSRYSKIPYDGKDKAGNQIDQTIIRYLTSKGLTKDSVGLSRLDSVDIRLIENSVSSSIYREHKAGIYPRLYQLFWEIDAYLTRGQITGSSIIQRFIYTKTSLKIIRDHLFWGVGVGDGKDKLFEYYEKYEKNLDKESWKTSHNQYLNVLIASGLIGFFMFMFGLLYPFFYRRRFKLFLPFVFMILILLSMLSIETLERHIGASFVALFYSLFFFGYHFEDDQQQNK